MTGFPPQISKLIPRLASEHDGEVVATVRAIERILRASGLDWHDLAKQVEPPKPIYRAYGFAHSPSPTPEYRPDPPPPSRKPQERGWSDMLRSEQTAWCDAILKSRSLPLDDKTLSFITEVLNKLHFGITFHMDRRKTRLLNKLIKELKEQRSAA